jgi:hypothetical protein
MTTGLITVLVAFITAVLGPVILEWVKQRTHNGKKSAELSTAIEFNDLIDDQLELIIQELECDNIWIAQFHNGGHFYPTGRSIQKFSIFYEKLSSETQSFQTILQNIPVSLFSKMVSRLHKDGEIALFNPTDNDELGMNTIIKEYNIKSWYAWALNDLDGKFIGILFVSYSTKTHKYNKEDWMFIRQKIGVISSLLSNYLYFNNKK